jgi:hypothetical protein
MFHLTVFSDNYIPLAVFQLCRGMNKFDDNLDTYNIIRNKTYLSIKQTGFILNKSCIILYLTISNKIRILR